MINKLIIDGHNVTLNEQTKLPFTYTFATSGVHNVRVGLDNSNEICAYAFKDCTELTKVVNIPETITMIKRNAFENCSSLKQMSIPSSVEYVGPNVFDGCVALEELKFEATTPPKFFTTLSERTNCYIPDYSKFVKVEDNSTLVKDGSIQYYEKNILGGYDEVDYEALTDDGEYYYDNWTSVHDHYNVIEERFRIKPTQIQFIDEDVVVTSYGTINAGDSGQIRDHRLLPENNTNDKVYFYSTNDNILQVDQSGHFTTNSNLQGNARVNVCACTEPDYNGTYAFTTLSFTIRASQVAPTVIDMQMSFPENYLVTVLDANIGDTIEFDVPTLSGDNTLTNPEITYSSSDEDVVKFENGILKVVGEGDATITATYAGDATHTSAIASFPISVALHVEDTQEYTITFKDGDEIVGTITGPMGTYVSVPDVEKPGYEFNGWSLDGEHVTMPVDGIYDSDITYIAVWSKIEGTVETEFESDDEGNVQLINTDNEGTIETEFESDDEGNVQLINSDDEGTIETEFESDESGDVQLINSDIEEGTIETEFDTDDEGDAQIINENND